MDEGNDNHDSNHPDPDDVEKQIDACRLSCDWDGVLTGIKRYAHIFDVGAATSTYQHATLDSVRAYYWVCMGEAVYETKKDYYNAIDCSKRALAIDPYCVEARIIMTRILLENSGSALNTNTARYGSHDNEGLLSVDLDAGSVLSEHLESFTKMDQKVLIEAVCSFEIILRNVLLATIEALQVTETVPICKEMLPLIQGKTMSNIELAKRFVLIIARNLLASVDLIDIVGKFNSFGLSEYRHWLFLDAVVTRMMIHHHLADTMASISEGIFFLNTMLPSDESTDPRSSSSFIFSNLPEICRNIVLSAACSLPLMERSQSLLIQSLDSFYRCVSGNSVLHHYYPSNIRLGMNVEAALSMLLSAKNKHQASLSPSLSSPSSLASLEDIVLDYNFSSLDIQADVDNAFSLLTVAHSIMSEKADPGSLSSSPTGIEPLRKSLLRSLPLSAYEPARYLKSGCGSTVGALMSTIIRLRDSADAATGKSISMLEWGMSLEIRPKVDLLFLLAGACCNGGRWEHAIELLEQCHFSLVMESKKKENEGKKPDNAASLSVGELLTWLGAGRSPSSPHNRWLPLARASEICLLSLSDPCRARNYTRRCLLECYEKKGLTILNSVNSDEATEVMRKEVFSIENLAGKIKDIGVLTVEDPSIFIGISEGEMSLLFLLGKIHSFWSRKVSISDCDKIRHLTVSVRVFDVLLQQNIKIKDNNTKNENNGKKNQNGNGNKSKIIESPNYGNSGFGGAFSILSKSLSFGLSAESKKDIIESGVEGVRVVLDEEKVSELSLEYAVCLAELGEISAAVKYVRAAIDKDPGPSANSQFLHLLSLLTSSAGDDAKIIGTAAALCKMASEIPPNRIYSVTQKKILNYRISSIPFNDSEKGGNSMDPYNVSSDDYGEVKFEKNIVKNENLIENGENEVGELGVDGVNSANNGVDISEGLTTLNITTATSQSLNKNNDGSIVASPNARLTLAMFECVACGYHISLQSIDSIISATLCDFKDIIDYQHALREYTIATSTANDKSKNKNNKIEKSKNEDFDDFSDYFQEESPPILPADQYERMDCPQTVRTIIDILISCSRFYRRAGKILKAKSCLEDGWRLLFLPQRDAMYGVSDILADDGANISEHKRIDILRHVPTLTGWRLSEASGWGAKGHPELEAELLCEVALQSDKSSTGKELLLMALSLCPDYVPALIALTNMELITLEGSNSSTNSNSADKKSEIVHTTGDNQIKYFSRIIEDSEDAGCRTDVRTVCGESEAYGFAMAAVRARYLNPECWYVLGRVYQSFGLFLEAGEAFSTSLEGLRHDPIRPFSSVLNDIYVQPLKDAQKVGRL